MMQKKKKKKRVGWNLLKNKSQGKKRAAVKDCCSSFSGVFVRLVSTVDKTQDREEKERMSEKKTKKGKQGQVNRTKSRVWSRMEQLWRGIRGGISCTERKRKRTTQQRRKPRRKTGRKKRGEEEN